MHTALMRDSLIALVVLAAVMAVGQTVLRRRRRRAPAHVPWVPGQPLVIRPPPRNAVMAGITALIPTALVLALVLRSWFAEPRRIGAVGLAGGIAVALALLAIAVHQFASAVRVRVVVHDTGLERVGVFRRRVFGWGSVAKLAYNPAQHWFFLTTTGGAHVWLPADVPGIPEFAHVAVRRLPRAVLDADPYAREVLEELAGAGEQPSHGSGAR